MRITVTKKNIVLPFKMRLDIDSSVVPYMPEVVEEVENVPGVDGDKQLSARYSSTNHILVARSWPDITPNEKAAMVKDIDAFIALARRETQQLHYEQLGRTYRVRYVGEAGKERERASWLEFRLPLKAHDPLGYADNESSLTGTGTANNRGNEPCPARIEFKGPAANPYIIANGVTYRYTGAVAKGSTLVADAAEQRAYIRNDSSNTQTNANRGWNGNYLVLQPGPATNVSAVSPGGGEFKLFWRNRWA